jgi:hypothetical protein
MGVLENYLSSKYGKSGVSMAGIGSGIMTGGANTATTQTGFPTMNIPVVATMPMAGMMPIQQGGNGGGGVQQGQAQQPQQQQQAGQGTPGQQTGGGGIGPEPNAQGVKTFSIKL